MALGYDTTSPIDLRNVTISADLSEQVSAFCETARQRGAQVLLSFSPMNRSALTDESDDVFLAFYERMRAALPCRVISDPRRYVLDSGWFYDSNFHLNSAGAAYRTMLLAEDLLAEFGCYQPLDAELPTMPAPVVQSASWAEDTGDFVFAETADGQAYCIAGLTEQGKAKGTLMLPASYQGKPVIGAGCGGADRGGCTGRAACAGAHFVAAGRRAAAMQIAQTVGAGAYHCTVRHHRAFAGWRGGCADSRAVCGIRVLPGRLRLRSEPLAGVSGANQDILRLLLIIPFQFTLSAG